MSEWYDADDDAFDMVPATREVNICVTENDFGNIYVTITFDQIKKLCDEIKSIEDDLRREA